MGTGKIRGRAWTTIASLLPIFFVACAGSQSGFGPREEQSEGDRLFEESMAAADAGDGARAFELMQQAAELGEPEAIAGLGTYVNTGIGTPVDPIRARDLYEEAVKRGSIAGKLNLGLMLLASDEPADQTRAFDYLHDLYEAPPKGRGRGSIRNVAAGGLGTAYVFGRGVEPDVERGVDLLIESDEDDEATPQVHFLLGRVFESGWGGRRVSPRKSFHHFRQAADAGVPAAQWRLGMAFINGFGTKRDEAAAYPWIRRAAEEGDENAEISLAVMLALGQGVAENDEEAREWYGRGVARNLAHALRSLGVMLIHGEGGPVDASRGWAYLKLAADAGEPTARQGVELLEVEVAEGDRKAGEALAAEWVTKYGRPKLLDD
ncbi:SEL1-like repeat protein [Myxococcota bacterium]|nr:SEL1-like repeat protein [Myxococcota bacterium]